MMQTHLYLVLLTLVGSIVSSQTATAQTDRPSHRGSIDITNVNISNYLIAGGDRREDLRDRREDLRDRRDDRREGEHHKGGHHQDKHHEGEKKTEKSKIISTPKILRMPNPRREAGE